MTHLKQENITEPSKQYNTNLTGTVRIYSPKILLHSYVPAIIMNCFFKFTTAAQNVCGDALQLLSEEGHVGLSDIHTIQHCD